MKKDVLGLIDELTEYSPSKELPKVNIQTEETNDFIEELKKRING